MAKKLSGAKPLTRPAATLSPADGERAGVRGRPAKPSALLDTRVVYCGDNLEQLAKLPDACGKQMQKDEGRMMKSAHFPILHSSFILLNSPVTGSFYYHCDWHASHYVLVKADVAALN